MNEIKLARWRLFLVLFLLLTLVNLSVDCLYKSLYKMPLRNAMQLLLDNAVLPAIVAVGLYVYFWIRKR